MLARHAVDDTKDIESNTQTDSEMETEADPEGQSGEVNLVLARYAETESIVNDDSDDDISDTEADSEGQWE